MRVIKWIGGILLALLLLLVVVGAVLHTVGASRLARAADVPSTAVPVPTDAAAIARGEHIATAISGCAECHGANLAGTVFIEGAPIGYVAATNLTAGAGGVGATNTDADWERAIRHGVGADGRALFIMPSQAYARMSDEDVGALIAYLKQVPPVDSELRPRAIQFPGTLFLGVLGYGSLPVNLTDHASVGGASPEAGATVPYGEYLSHIAGCRDCHGENLAGGTNPEAAIGQNLTPGGELQGWSQEDFVTALRTGQTPSGRTLSDEMPWKAYANMSDEEVAALYLYLASLPPTEANPMP